VTEQPLDKIILYGHGLAFETTLAAFSENLPANIQVLAVETKSIENKDSFYGNVTPPQAYDFHRFIGVSEPELIYKTDTGFAYGTYYKNWANKLDWVQSYNLPFPIWNGVPFHHYLLNKGLALEPYLVGAICGRKGKFVHPPPDRKIALSRAEYGYQLRPITLCKFLRQQPHSENITRLSGKIKQLHMDGKSIKSVELDGKLMKAIGNHFQTERSLHITESFNEGEYSGSSVRRVNGEIYGWRSLTTSRTGKIVKTVCHPSMEDKTNLRRNDIEHCKIFQVAFFATDTPLNTPYWQDIMALPISPKLNRKLTQFTSRGFLTKFDLEPFNEEDWTILHFGMQRKSQRHIDYTDSLPDNIIEKNLDELENSIQLISEKVPPHAKYVANFMSYLEKKMQ